MRDEIQCPGCGGDQVIKNGRTRHDRQGYRCKVCNRQFTADPMGRISEELKRVADRMIKDGLPIGKIMEYTGISASWLYDRKRNLKFD